MPWCKRNAPHLGQANAKKDTEREKDEKDEEK